MKNEEQNSNNPQNSAFNIADVSSSFFKPLCEGELNELKNKIYKEQFFDYDETVDAEKVLDALQNLKSNPKLLDYVMKCLVSQKIGTQPRKFYCIIIHKEHFRPYDENFWKQFDAENPFGKWMKECVEGKWDMKKEDILFPKVFNSISDIEDFCKNIDEVKKEIPFWTTHKDNENILFEKYSIRELGAVAV